MNHENSNLRGLVDRIMVCHSGVETALRLFDRCYHGAIEGGDSRGLAVLGESGTGKSRLLKYVSNQYAPYRDADGLKIPILLASVLSKPTVKGMAEDLLYRLGDKAFDKGSERVKTNRIKTLIRATGVRVLMLDEAQHLVDQATLKVQHHVSDWLKDLVDDTNVSPVIAGLTYFTSVMETNPQLKRRFQAPLLLPRFNWAKIEHRSEFCAFLAAMQANLAPFELPDLSHEDIAFRMYCATGGLVGRVANVFKEAIADSLDKGQYSIGIEELGRAASVASFDMPLSLGGNPFERNFKALPTEEFISEVMRLGATERPPIMPKTRRHRACANITEALSL